jgi:hypothetical protein
MVRPDATERSEKGLRGVIRVMGSGDGGMAGSETGAAADREDLPRARSYASFENHNANEKMNCTLPRPFPGGCTGKWCGIIRGWIG